MGVQHEIESMYDRNWAIIDGYDCAGPDYLQDSQVYMFGGESVNCDTRDACKLSNKNWIVNLVFVNGDVVQQDDVLFYEIGAVIQHMSADYYDFDDGTLAYGEGIVEMVIIFI